ncbi:MAG: Cof-type HAD-IIB family hydrolase [Candidatus Dormibacteria bacterium]
MVGMAAAFRPTAATAVRLGDPSLSRPSQPPRLVALDLDGTCLQQSSLPERTGQAVRRSVAAGRSTIVVATGRTYRTAMPWVEELGVTEPVICFGGAVIRRPPGAGDPTVDGSTVGATLFSASLDHRDARRAIQLIRRGGWQCIVDAGERVFSEPRRGGGEETTVSAGRSRVELIDDVERLLESGPVHRVVALDPDPASADRAEGLLREALGGVATVVRSLPTYVEVASPAASKGQALHRLCRLWDIDPQDTVAAGDNGNDLDLISAAGLGVAVANAVPEVLAAAALVVPSVGECGVADLLGWLGVDPAAD